MSQQSIPFPAKRRSTHPQTKRAKTEHDRYEITHKHCVLHAPSQVDHITAGCSAAGVQMCLYASQAINTQALLLSVLDVVEVQGGQAFHVWAIDHLGRRALLRVTDFHPYLYLTAPSAVRSLSTQPHLHQPTSGWRGPGRTRPRRPPPSTPAGAPHSAQPPATQRCARHWHRHRCKAPHHVLSSPQPTARSHAQGVDGH